MKKTSLLAVIMFSFFIWNLTLWAGFSQEFQDAYRFAYNNKITTINNIENADMNWWLTRIAMAKMLSQYAINILWKTPDTWRKANFSDVSTQLDEQYNDWVTLAYQLWIMWIWIDKFRPFDSVTRAEFGTALSRVLFWNIYNQEWSNYYSKHLAALKIAGIMTKIDTPNQKEIRWYVMIMLMRSDGWNWNGSSNNDNPVIKPNTNNNTWTNTTKTWNVATTWNTTSSWWWGWGGWWWGWGGWWWGWGGWWWGWGGWWWGWSTTTSKYTVTRLNDNGSTLETDENVPSGTIPTYDGSTPVRWVGDNDNSSFIFSWWKPAVGAITWDTTYKAQFTSLIQDNQKRLNVLIMWYWWEYWEWYHLLPDSIMIASWNMVTNEVDLISLPFPDYYYKNIFSYFNYQNANSTNHTLQRLIWDVKSWAKNVLWLEIRNYITMDFTTFKRAIDILWWIDLYVDEPIIDNQFPNDVHFPGDDAEFTRNTVWWYAPLSIGVWQQHLDWETTLKYVRSINTTSNSDRAYRQQKVLKAIKDKVAVSWFNISQIYNLYDLYHWKIDNDFNFSDAVWIATHLKNIEKFSSFEYSSKIPYIKLDWSLNSVDWNIALTSFSITWTSAYWKAFSWTSLGNVVQYELFIGNESYLWSMLCEKDNNENIQCRTNGNYNISNIELRDWEDLNVWLIIKTSPLVKHNVEDAYYVTLNGMDSNGSRSFRIPVTLSTDKAPVWISISIVDYCTYYNQYSNIERGLVTVKVEKNSKLVENLSTLVFNVYDANWDVVTENTSVYFMQSSHLFSNFFGVHTNLSERWVPFVTEYWYIIHWRNSEKIADEWSNIEFFFRKTDDISWYHISLDEINGIKLDNDYTYESCTTGGTTINPDCDDPLIMIACILEEDSWVYDQCPVACRIDCDDPLTVIACTTNSEECPLVCRQGGDNPETPDNPNNPEPNGNLDISVISPFDWRKLVVWWTSDMDTLRFASSEEITVSKITLERYWYSAWSDVVGVWLENEDWWAITTVKTIDDNDHVTLSILKDFKTIDWIEKRTVVVELSENATNWWTMWFKVISVESSASNIEIDNSNVQTYDIVSYEWSTLEVSNRLSDANHIYDESEFYKIASIKLKAPATSAALVNWFTFTNKWDFNINLLDDVLLEVDWESENISYSIKNWEIISSFDSVEIPAKASATFDFYGTLPGLTEFWKYIQLSIEESSDIKATEKKTWARMLADLENITWPKLYLNQETEPGDNPGDNSGDIPDDNPGVNPGDIPGDIPGDEDPEDTEDCAYIKVDNWTSYCFNITKVSGSTFWVSIKGDAEGVYWCSIMWEEGTNIWVFNSCSYNEFTILPSSGTHDFRIKLKYDGKEYSRKATYNLTYWVFVSE